MSSLGISPLGTDLGEFGGIGKITIKGVLVTGSREFVIVWDRVPRFRADGALKDASELPNYLLVAVDPTIQTQNGPYVPHGSVVPKRTPILRGLARDKADPLQILAEVDCDSEPRAEYDLTIFRIEAETGEVLAGPLTWRLRGLGLPAAPVVRETLRLAADPLLDIQNAAIPGVELAGWTMGPGGKFLRHGGIQSLRKRVFRRIITSAREMQILGPDYSADLQVQVLARPSTLQVWANRLQTGIAQEPDVAAVQVRVTTPASGAEQVDITVAVTYRDTRAAVLEFTLKTT